ncbi:Sec-independent protein translocase subunit TatA/TatB [Marinilabilia rubra]|uniref:Sec-independent protein translocase protein TatA n=1 Tax=Marinilabilia rubra TaxID=2162893 RepID=A0A2U2B801_9BACT|nr:twin-arginine translocase TatA/TatE family subunit [Marinilabilia rubra]PWD99187.1 twin-arginine translocase TatA/TatE family subunit [Marinilabilia rubra]
MELNSIFLFGIPSGMEWVLVILALLLLFGGRKIPELMKGLGQGMKEFKKARNEASDDSKKSVDESNGKDDEKKS